MADIDIRRATVISVGGFMAVNVDGARYENPWFPAHYTPTEGDYVSVIVSRGEVTVLGEVTEGPIAETGATDPDTGPTTPAEPTTGKLKITAVDSGSRNSGGWLYNDVRQGTYGAYTYTGAYFYGAKPNQLEGATITAARIYLGARTPSGLWDSSLSLNMRRVTNQTKPSGSLSFTGATDVLSVGTYPQSAQWVSLDTTIAQALVDAGGGGLGVSGSPYGGVEGLNDDPSAGTLELTWTL